MKKTLFAIVMALLLCLSAGAQTKSTKVVTDSVAFLPASVQIYQGTTRNGNPKFWIELPTADGVRKVSLTESHVTSGRMLALIERKDTTTGKFSYSIKFAEPRRSAAKSGKADLSALK
jgi:hypothetical protein